jgi:divalent metal cation (Fe/Co/Zn/Cd) transporter
MRVQAQTSAEYFKALSILCSAMMFGMVLMGVVVMILSYENEMDFKGFGPVTFSVLVPVCTIIGLAASILFFRYKLKYVRKLTDLKEKMHGYGSACIARYAFLEFPAFVAIIVVMLSSNHLYFLYAVCMLAFMFLWRPSRVRAIAELELDEKEQALVNDRKAVIAEFKTK